MTHSTAIIFGTAMCMLIISGSVCAQDVQVQGRLVVTEMDTSASDDMMVVKQPDGTLAGRQFASLLASAEDTSRNLMTDLLLTSLLCDCTTLPPAMISSLLDHGYTSEDLVNFGVSTSDLVDAGSSVSELLQAGVCPIEIFNSGVPADSLYGRTYAGGLIFYLDTLDLYPFKGLVAAESDQDNGQWGCYCVEMPIPNGFMDTGGFIGAGESNTIGIDTSCAEADIAAKICSQLELNGYSDWFLPSFFELFAMWTNLADSDGNGTNTGPGDPNNLGGFASTSYWSSTEGTNPCGAYRVNFMNGAGAGGLATKLSALSVRAARAFD